MTLTQAIAAEVAQRLADASSDHRYNVRRAGELFVEFAGFDPPAANISHALLDSFEAWCRQTGRPKNAARYRSILQSAIRTTGAALPRRKPGGRRKDAYRPPEPIEGSLWHLFVTSYKRRHRSSARTEFQYRVQLNHFAKSIGHEPTLGDLTDAALEAFVEDRAAKVAAPTANKAYWALTALWRHAYDLGLVKLRPTIQPLPEPDAIPFAWLKEEIEALLQACSAVEGQIDGVPARLWWLGLHWFIWSTGERIGAVLAIKRTDVHLGRGEAFVPAAVRKGRRKPKLYPLLPQAVEILGQADAFERDLLFPWSMDQSTLYGRYKRILAAAGLPTDRKCKFHRMRRSFASYIEAAGGNATMALGHSTRRIAERSYLDPRICGGQDVTRLLPALIGGPAHA